MSLCNILVVELLWKNLIDLGYKYGTSFGHKFTRRESTLIIQRFRKIYIHIIYTSDKKNYIVMAF